MPITPLHPVRRLSQDEFAELSYAVMGCVFDFEDHTRRLLAHADLRAILWANVALHRVTFVTVQ